MSTHDEQPSHDESADGELSTSLAGHEALSEDGGTDRSIGVEDDESSSPLEEIDDSPVRTENS